MDSKIDQILNNEESLYVLDSDYQEKYFKERPWKTNDTHFKKVMISTLAVMKVVDHAIRGGKMEICGYLVGFARDAVFYVLDAVELPIMGTDSRVEIGGEIGPKTYSYTANFLEVNEKVGRAHNYVGWYHSHPGFGCWLSGIDCQTQKNMQTGFQTWFAMVVDPYRTKSNRKVELGCFMVYTDESNTRMPNQEFDSVPLDRADEFGIHQSKYYRLPHSYFQSKYESQIVKLIYKNYWVDTLSSNALLVNDDFYNEQVGDMTAKMRVYNLNKKAQDIKNENQNEIHQKKLNDVAKLNTQANVNLQNEVLKAIIFNE